MRIRLLLTIPMDYTPLMKPRAAVAHLAVFCAAPALTANTGGIHLGAASLQPALLQSLKAFTQSIGARDWSLLSRARLRCCDPSAAEGARGREAWLEDRK
jgi:hypothetical protein